MGCGFVRSRFMFSSFMLHVFLLESIAGTDGLERYNSQNHWPTQSHGDGSVASTAAFIRKNNFNHGLLA